MAGEKVEVVAKKGVKKSVGVAKKTKAKPTHPPTATMVNVAIRTLKERGGSSLSAIKKYLASNYKVDVEKLAPFVKKYLKNAVAGGLLVQTKGKGATGSFKLAAKAKVDKPNASKKSAVKGKKKEAASVAKAAKKSKTVKSAPKEKSMKKPVKIIKTKKPKAKKAVKSV